jgi:RNA polymerase sigma-70 factor (ECF subfamily)
MSSTAEQAKAGNPDAIRQIVSDHYPIVYRFCARRIGELAAQDITQEVFITMHQTIKRFQSKSSLKTWILGIALNHCRNYQRKNKKPWLSLENWFTPNQSFENQVVDSQFINQALAKLSDDHREVVVLHEIEELSYAEIADLLKLPEGTVKSRLHHAFQALRKQGANV